MSHHDHVQHAGDQPRGQGSSRGKIAFAALLAVALFFLLTEHRAHFFGFLPYLLLIACPLLHLFHHGGHGHGSQAPLDRRTPTGKEN